MTESQQTQSAVRVQRTYDASAQAVFEAWTNVEVIRRWWHAGDASWETTRAEVDLRVGGRLLVTMRTPDGTEHTGSGEYVEVRPPERLAFTWTWAGSEDSPGAGSLVEVEFAEEDGATTVVLTHSGLAGEESAQSHSRGWDEVLANLARELGG
jgi:uncharacterized protein YndB with AHSA1/START domain